MNALGDPAGDPLSANTGLELEFDTTFLNLDPGATEVRFFAFVTNGELSPDFVIWRYRLQGLAFKACVD